MKLTVLPLLAERKMEKFDIFESMQETLERNNERFQDGDVIVISTKYISNAQGRIINIQKTRVSEKSKKISEKFQLRPEIAEII